MMRLVELPRLKAAFDLMGLDNGADVSASAVIPTDWIMRAQVAEDELSRLSQEQTVDLVMGEESDAKMIADLAPAAAEVLLAAFDDGPLSEIVFDPWQSIFDARRAERRLSRPA